jgi:Domain of unknown function (DUF4270)
MRRRNLFLLIPVSLIILFGCTKLDRTTLGGDLLPGTDRLNTDTMLLPVETTSYIENDTSTIEKADQHILGYINDPMFGTTTASMFVQMLPPSYPFFYPVAKDSLFLDSCVLSLSYAGIHGDTNAVSKVNVYKITDPTFISTKLYKIKEAVNFSTADFLGTTQFTAISAKKGYKSAYKTDTIYNQVRVRLNNTFGRLLLDQDNITGALRNDTAFKQFLNGFAIIPDSTVSGNAISYFSLTNTDTRINLYYRYTKRDGTGLDTTVSRFAFVNDTIRSANANKVYRNYTGSIAAPYLTSGLPSNLAFIQAGPGTAVKIKVPGLDTIKNKPYIVHRAELVARQIYLGPLLTEKTLLQPTLHLFTYNTDGSILSIPYDSAFYFTNTFSFDLLRKMALYRINTTYTGGNPDFITDASNNLVAEYKMNITSYVQHIINGTATRRDFKLSAPYFAEFANAISSSSSINPLAYGRVQLGGGNHPQYRMYVRIYYSKQ